MANNKSRISYRPNGVAEVKEQLTMAVVEELKIEGISRLSLRGEASLDLRYLSQLKNNIEKLYIRGAEKIDWCSLYDLNNVRAVLIDSLPDDNVDFSKIDGIQMLQIVVGGKAIKLVVKNDTLVHLQVRKWPHKDLVNLLCGKSMKELSLVGARSLVSLYGIQNCLNLEFLELQNLPKFSDVENITELGRLKYLIINNCANAKMHKVLPRLDSVVELSFTGAVDNIDFLKHMSSLKRLRLDANVRSGDMRRIFNCHSLEQVIFRNKKNQTHTLKEVHKYLEKKGFEQRGIHQEYRRLKIGLG